MIKSATIIAAALNIFYGSPVPNDSYYKQIGINVNSTTLNYTLKDLNGYIYYNDVVITDYINGIPFTTEFEMTGGGAFVNIPLSQFKFTIPGKYASVQSTYILRGTVYVLFSDGTEYFNFQDITDLSNTFSIDNNWYNATWVSNREYDVIDISSVTNYGSKEISGVGYRLEQLFTRDNVELGSIADNYEVVDFTNFILSIVTIPFTFISQAFDFTLFPGTPYALNISALLLSIIGILALSFILIKLIGMIK